MRTRHISLSFYGWVVTKGCRLFHRVGKGGYRLVERPGLAFQQGYVWIKTAYVSGQACSRLAAGTFSARGQRIARAVGRTGQLFDLAM